MDDIHDQVRDQNRKRNWWSDMYYVHDQGRGLKSEEWIWVHNPQNVIKLFVKWKQEVYLEISCDVKIKVIYVFFVS